MAIGLGPASCVSDDKVLVINDGCAGSADLLLMDVELGLQFPVAAVTLLTSVTRVVC